MSFARRTRVIDDRDRLAASRCSTRVSTGTESWGKYEAARRDALWEWAEADDARLPLDLGAGEAAIIERASKRERGRTAKQTGGGGGYFIRRLEIIKLEKGEERSGMGRGGGEERRQLRWHVVQWHVTHSCCGGGGKKDTTWALEKEKKREKQLTKCKTVSRTAELEIVLLS